VFAQSFKKPSRLEVFLPNYIATPNNAWANNSGKNSWQDYVMAKVHGMEGFTSTKKAWVAYSDRDNNATYSSAGGGSATGNPLSFMQKVYIAKMANVNGKAYALVFSSDNIVKGNSIPKDAEWYGWLSVDNLLLWEQCPRNAQSIYQKGIVVGDPKHSTNIQQNPPFHTSPSDRSATNGNAKNLEPLFIMKVSSGANKFCLLSKDYIISNNPQSVSGWLNAKVYVQEWSHRLCIEPTYNSTAVAYYKNKGIYPTCFKNTDFGNASNFYAGQKVSESSKFWGYKQMSTRRMPARIFRFPVLGKSTNENILEVATISTLSQSTVYDMVDAEAKLIKDLDKENTLNIMFVIDATSSMQNYVQPVIDAIQELRNLDVGRDLMRYGVVLYRSSADGDREIKTLPCGNFNSAINFLNSVKYDLSSKGKNHYKSFFKALNTALDATKMGYSSENSNFIIAIGNSGNAAQQGAELAIAKKMKTLRVNFIAFQVNKVANNQAYTAFANQIGKIASETVKLRTPNGDGKIKLVANRWYWNERTSNDNADAFAHCGYMFAPSDKAAEDIENLKNNVIAKVVDFQKFQTQKYAQIIHPTNEKLLREILVDYGYSGAELEKMIAVLKSDGVTKIRGYAPIKTQGADVQLFDYVLFFTHTELENLVTSVKSLKNTTDIDNRKVFHDALITMGQAMLGNMSKEKLGKMAINDLLSQIAGMPIQCHTSIIINDILSPSKISNTQLQDIIDGFVKKIGRLEQLKNSRRDEDGCFKSLGGELYHWIKVTDVPGYNCE
jgi:hypothetical protein